MKVIKLKHHSILLTTLLKLILSEFGDLFLEVFFLEIWQSENPKNTFLFHRSLNNPLISSQSSFIRCFFTCFLGCLELGFGAHLRNAELVCCMRRGVGRLSWRWRVCAVPATVWRWAGEMTASGTAGCAARSRRIFWRKRLIMTMSISLTSVMSEKRMWLVVRT